MLSIPEIIVGGSNNDFDNPPNIRYGSYPYDVNGILGSRIALYIK